MQEKDRNKTEEKILKAVEAIVLKEGVSAIKINNIARAAGVSKVLIYRYFGGIDQLLEKFIVMNDYWIKNTRNHALQRQQGESLRQWILRIVKGQFHYLMNSRLQREIMKWQLTEDNELTRKLDSKREFIGIQFTKEINEQVNDGYGLDLFAITAILTGGIYYLPLKTDQCNIFNGVSLNDEQGLKRLDKGIEQLVDIILNLTQK